MMRGTTILPHGTGKSKRIAVFTADEAEAKKA
jgi:ribosomal protein L1